MQSCLGFIQYVLSGLLSKILCCSFHNFVTKVLYFRQILVYFIMINLTSLLQYGREFLVKTAKKRYTLNTDKQNDTVFYKIFVPTFFFVCISLSFRINSLQKKQKRSSTSAILGISRAVFLWRSLFFYLLRQPLLRSINNMCTSRTGPSNKVPCLTYSRQGSKSSLHITMLYINHQW